MTNTLKNTITTFCELNSFIINTEVPTILAFTAPNTFGQYWLERMKRSLTSSFIPGLTFNIIFTQKVDELEILTKEGGGPIIFFISNRKIITKSMRRVSEHDFMEHLKQIQPVVQAA